MATRNTTKRQIRQGLHAGILTISVCLLSGCSLFETTPSSVDAILPKGGKGSLQQTSTTTSVPVKPLATPAPLTDVSLELRLPDAPIEFITINYGSSKNNLNNHKRISREALTLLDDKDQRYRFILKDVGELRPLYANIIIEAGGFKSEPSETFEVTE